MSTKPRVVKDYDKLDQAILEQLKLEYPYGFDRKLIMFKNAEGKLISALPFETEDRYYLIRMTREEANRIIEEDDDYNEDGNLKASVKKAYEDKYDDGDDEFGDMDMDDDDFGDDMDSLPDESYSDED